MNLSGAKLRNRIRVCPLEEQHYAKVAAGIDVIGVEGNNGLKLGCREFRLLLLQKFRSLAGVRFDLLLAIRTRLGEAR